jgi:hypothetical protein
MQDLFSENYRWVTLPDIQSSPIELTEGQAKVFESLWKFKGQPVATEQIMKPTAMASEKPSDLFKVRSKDKDNPSIEA